MTEKDQFEIKHVWHKNLSTFQQRVAHILYWGGFFGDNQLITMYINHLGVSPFMKIENGKNLVAACVEGQQYDQLKLLIEDSVLD